MLHKEFFGYVFLGFIAWVFLAASPQQRIEHLCRPVGWIGNGTVSMSTLVVPNQQERVQGWFDKVEYSCRYVTWRLVYQEDYNKWLATQQVAPAKADEGDTEKTSAKTEGSAVPAAAAAPGNTPKADSASSGAQAPAGEAGK